MPKVKSWFFNRTGLFLLGPMLVMLAMILGIVYGGRRIKPRFRKAQ